MQGHRLRYDTRKTSNHAGLASRCARYGSVRGDRRVQVLLLLVVVTWVSSVTPLSALDLPAVGAIPGWQQPTPSAAQLTQRQR